MNLADSRKTNVLGRLRPGLAFGLIIIVALLAFESFNYSTTEYALNDLLGNLKFFGIAWSTILSIAFCGIDFAGIARLFTPQQGAEEPKEVWYLFGAWLLAATMNAVLTWWGVSMAVVNHAVTSTAIMDATTLNKVVPVFVAVMVWVIRILIIGTLSVAGERMFAGEYRQAGMTRYSRPAPSVQPSQAVTNQASSSPSLSPRPLVSRPLISRAVSQEISARPEPTYHTMSAAPRPGSRPMGDPSNK